jgi:hypothetical protein
VQRIRICILSGAVFEMTLPHAREPGLAIPLDAPNIRKFAATSGGPSALV